MESVIDSHKAFGERLREERERAGLKVHELAHLCGCPDVTQKRYEAGQTVIPIDYLQALSRRTDISVLYVLNGAAKY